MADVPLSPPSIESIDLSPSPVSIPDYYHVKVVLDRQVYGSGYHVVIVNDDSGGDVQACDGSNECSYTGYADWDVNEDPQPRHYHAEVRYDNTVNVVARSAQVTAHIDPFTFQFESAGVSPNPVAIPSSYVVTATLNRQMYAERYYVAIVDDDSGNDVQLCGSAGDCTYSGYAGWDVNEDPQPRRYHAEVRREYTDNVVARSAAVTVQIDPFDFKFKSIDVSPDPVTIPGYFDVKATINRQTYGTGYHVEFVDDQSGNDVQDCYNSDECTYRGYVGWDANEDPQPRHYHAEVRRDNTDHVVARIDTTVDLDQTLFPVDLLFPDPPTGSAENPQWRAVAHTSRDVYGSPYAIRIKDRAGNTVASCVIDQDCSTTLGAGTYRASVEDSDGPALGLSSWWTLTAGQAPQDEDVDDVDLVGLAGRFGSSSEVCDLLLTYPGTHAEGSSLSDQTIACETAETAGASIAALLRAVAGAGGGTAVLWYLDEQQTRTTAPVEPDDPDPIPAPDVVYQFPESLPSDVDGLLSRNSNILTKANGDQTEAGRVARRVLKSCYRYRDLAAEPESDCRQLPIFVSGDNVPEATQHDREAILKRPIWGQLNYEDGKAKETRQTREWYTTEPACEAPDRPPNTDCDEYPFWASTQGGGNAFPKPSLKPISESQNRSQGASYGAFTRECLKRRENAPFLVVPVPSGSRVPTMGICNDVG